MRSFLTGLATGLAVGYLTAPRSGKETRQQLVDTANKQTEGLKAQLDKTVSQAKDFMNKAKSQTGTSSSTPNTFADIESNKVTHTDNMNYLSDPVMTGINNAETL